MSLLVWKRLPSIAPFVSIPELESGLRLQMCFQLSRGANQLARLGLLLSCNQRDGNEVRKQQNEIEETSGQIPNSSKILSN
jgi:hypothetical protein